MRTQSVRVLLIAFTLIGTTYAQTYTACDPTNGMSLFAVWSDFLLTFLSDLPTNARS